MTGPNSCPTVKVKPWGKGQGDFVEINAEDFDADIHELFVDALDHDANGKKGGAKKASKVEMPAVVAPVETPAIDPNAGWGKPE